jgi:alkylhydroperoxidase family enzyme
VRGIQPPPATSPVAERYRAGIERLLDAILRGRGDSDTAVRQAIARRASDLSNHAASPADGVPDDLVPYVDTVARCAYRTADADVQALREAGYSEDAIFEMTISAALGAGMARLEHGLAALRGGR